MSESVKHFFGVWNIQTPLPQCLGGKISLQLTGEAVTKYPRHEIEFEKTDTYLKTNIHL